MIEQLPEIVTIWTLVAAIIVAAHLRRHTLSTGLVLAYLFNLWMLHCLPAAIYLLPWYDSGSPELTRLGALQSLWAVVGFAVGNLLLAPLLLATWAKRESRQLPEPDRNLPAAYIWTGIAFYVLLSTAVGSLPSVTAIVSTGQQLAVVGIGLSCWQAWRSGDRRKMFQWIAAAFCFPVVTIVTRGFIGYGAAAVACVLIFVASFVRSRAIVAVTTIVLMYVGLSVFTTYMRDRGDIRGSVWGGEAYTSRFDQLAQTASSFEWFDPHDVTHLDRIDGRLNQNMLVGAAVNYVGASGEFAGGATLRDSVLALIPRAIWPDKPIQAGSGTLVSDYTGISFAAGTSVGIGQVMEFYVNFGTLGVFVGSALLATLITVVDTTAARSLANLDLHNFVLWYLPGISLLQVGGSMVEITVSVVASLFTALLANRVLDWLQRKQLARATSRVSPSSLRATSLTA